MAYPNLGIELALVIGAQMSAPAKTDTRTPRRFVFKSTPQYERPALRKEEPPLCGWWLGTDQGSLYTPCSMMATLPVPDVRLEPKMALTQINATPHLLNGCFFRVCDTASRGPSTRIAAGTIQRAAARARATPIVVTNPISAIG